MPVLGLELVGDFGCSFGDGDSAKVYEDKDEVTIMSVRRIDEINLSLILRHSSFGYVTYFSTRHRLFVADNNNQTVRPKGMKHIPHINRPFSFEDFLSFSVGNVDDIFEN